MTTQIGTSIGDVATAQNPVPHEGLRAQARELAPTALALVFALSWIGVEPFPSLGSDTVLQADKAVDPLNLLSYLAVGGLSVAVAFILRPHTFRIALRPITLLMLCWLVVSVITSSDPNLSARRLALTIVMIGMSIAVMPLPTNLRQFSKVLAAIALLVLALCFGGGMFLPQFAIHQLTDMPEPLLAGDWRGIFAHKNVAASMMVVFIFTGILTARVLDRYLGALIIALSLTFMFLAGGKTALALLAPTLLLAPVFLNSRSKILRALIVAAPVTILNLGTVGSVMFPAIGQFNKMMLPDPTFTGRTDIWQFALDNLQQRLTFGFGYSAFWQTSATMFGGKADTENAQERGDDIVSVADHAHNAYLDTALTTGLPGLALTITWLLVQPFWDISRAQRNGAPPALLLYFTQIWMFCINFACLESLYYHRTDPVWFMLLMATSGMAALARYRIKL